MTDKVFVNRDESRERELTNRLTDIVETANRWFIPLLNGCGLSVTISNLVGAMAGDAEKWFINHILDDKVGTAFSPSKLYEAGQQSKEDFYKALDKVVISMPDYTQTAEGLAAMARHKWQTVKDSPSDSFNPQIRAAQQEKNDRLVQYATDFDAESSAILNEKKEELRNEFLGTEHIFYSHGTREKIRLANGVSSRDYQVEKYSEYLSLKNGVLTFDENKVLRSCAVYATDKSEVKFLNKLAALEAAIKDAFGNHATMTDVKIFFEDEVRDYQAHIKRKDISKDLLITYSSR